MQEIQKSDSTVKLQRLLELERENSRLRAEVEELRQYGNKSVTQAEDLKGAILDAALDCIITIGRDSRIVEWNTAAERTFGFTRQEVLGRDLAQIIIPPEYRDAHYRGIAHFLAAGHGPVLRTRVEVEALRADGSRIPVELAISPLPLGGEPHFTAYLRDISERKFAERELRDREQQLRATYESAFAGIAEVGLDGQFLRVNEEYCRITGFSREELTGLSFRDLTYPDDLERDLENFGRLMAGEIAVYRLEKRFVHKAGYTVWVDISASRVDDEHGRPAYGVRVIREVTLRKQAEQRIRFQAHLLDSVEEAVIATDLTGKVIYWNRFAERLYGWRVEEALGQDITGLTPAAEASTNAAAILEQLRAGQAWSGEMLLRRRDGTSFPAHVSDAPVYGEDGNLVGIVGVSYDCTPRKQWEARQELLVNELNHRVKNTLATVQSVAAQTLRNASTTEEAMKVLEDRLLALSRTHDVLTREQWQGAEVEEIIGVALAPYHHAEEGRLHISGPHVRLLPRTSLALAMAFQELATNAVKYGALSNTTGEIRIEWTVSRRGDASYLELCWIERGGPKVGKPRRRGFGTRLIERGIAAELEGEAHLDFRQEGLVCRMTALIPSEPRNQHSVDAHRSQSDR